MRTLSLIVATLMTTQLLAAPTLSVTTRTERPPEMDTITIAEIGFDEERFAFVLPQNWRFDPDPTGSVLRFHSELNKAKITIQFSPLMPEGGVQSADAVRQLALPGLGYAQVIEEFPIVSNNGQGKGALFGYGLDWRCRAAVIPLARGCATFVLTCRTNEMSSQQTLGALVTSFRKVAAPSNAR